MEYQQLLAEIRPKEFGTFNVEPFEVYKSGVQKLLPNWPVCPLESWIHRHYDYFIDEYGWLGFDRMAFTLEYWMKERIFSQVNSHKLDMIEGMGKQIYRDKTSMSSWLQRYFISKGTWPVPIIVLNNTEGIIGVRGEKYGQPYHLLEGMVFSIIAAL